MRLSDVFDTLPDPRAANVSHRLGDLIVLMIAAAMCGRMTATDIALYAQLRAEALSPLLGDVPRPNHDTISRLLRLIDPAELAPRLTRFNAAFGAVIGRHVAIDGRVMRRARDAAARSTPHLMVNPWASEAGLALAAHPGP